MTTGIEQALTNVQLGRKHRFDEGDIVAHVDSPSETAEVIALTLRVHGGVAHPTYTLIDKWGEEFDDILCTRDLMAPEPWQSC